MPWLVRTGVVVSTAAQLTLCVWGAAVQTPYSKFIFGLREDNILLDRKVLSQLAHYEPFSFKSLVDRATHMSKVGLAHRVEAAAANTQPRC